jgi:hypothetical protein
MFQSTAPSYLLSGKFSCIYEDRTGNFTLRPSQQITNKLILDYKVGDKLIFKNTTTTLYDYLNAPGNDAAPSGQILCRSCKKKLVLETQKERDAAEKAVEELKRQLQPKRPHT